MSSSFAASTCRTALAPFRQGISPTPRLCAATRRIKYSKIVGAVGFEPTKPSLVSKVRSVAGGCWKWPDVPSSCGDRGWEWPGVSWHLRSLALSLALGSGAIRAPRSRQPTAPTGRVWSSSLPISGRDGDVSLGMRRLRCAGQHQYCAGRRCR